jgi:hypothetical protein
VKTPVVVPPSGVQFVDGLGFVPQHVPRAVRVPGIPADVTLAPRIALVPVIVPTVGVVTVGIRRVVNVESVEYAVPVALVA